MASTFAARGQSGVVKRGYHPVARLAEWTLSGDRLEARAADVNRFWLEQDGPTSVALQMGRKQWVWQDVVVVDPGTPFVVRVSGSPKVR